MSFFLFMECKFEKQFTGVSWACATNQKWIYFVPLRMYLNLSKPIRSKCEPYPEPLGIKIQLLKHILLFWILVLRN